MSSLTKDQFIEEMRVRSRVMFSMDEADADTFVDIALRAYSDKFPKLLWDVDNAVVSGQSLYDYPIGAMRIIGLRTSGALNPVRFTIEDQGSGNKIRPGSIEQGSLDGLLTQDYYVDPTNSGGSASGLISLSTLEDVMGYDAFDIEYVKLQTMAEISDNGLDALALYMEYLAYGLKASEAAEATLSESGEAASSISDSDSSGASTTVSLTTKESASKNFEGLAEKKLAAFHRMVAKVPYGRRG